MSQQIQRQRKQQGIAQGSGSLKLMPSSFIRDIDYDFMTGELWINMNGKVEGPWYVDRRTFNNFIMGKAVCVTNDPTGRNRWSRGDSPSLGAAFHKYIKIGGGPSLARRARARVRQVSRAVRGQAPLRRF